MIGGTVHCLGAACRTVCCKSRIDAQAQALAWGNRPIGNVDALRPQRRRCAAQAERKEPKLLVLAHGFWGGSRIQLTPFDYWRGITEGLQLEGYEVLVTEVPATATVAERADSLAEQIASWDRRAGERVTVLAHSMGGLDARYAISKLGASSAIRTLMTVASPHRGSPAADLLLRSSDTLHISSLAAACPSKFLADMPGGVRCLTTEACEDFNREVPDIEDVRYLSMGGDRGTPFRTSPELLPLYLHVLTKEGPNDGLVSVASSRWGEYAGTLDMDHLHQINFPLPHRWITGAPSFEEVTAKWRWVAEVATSPPSAESGETA